MKEMAGAVVAFGFFQPWLLGWLAAATIPVVIHLWSRHRCHQIPWAAMEFLLAALKARQRRLLLEQLLLLCLRVLILVILALAVARPFIGHSAFSGDSSMRVHRVVLLDASLSMQAEHGGTSSFERAKKELQKLLNRSHANDLVSLGTFTSTISWLMREVVNSAVDMPAQLVRLRPVDANNDLPKVFPEVLTAIRETGARNLRIGTQEVWIFSDLQATNWMPRDAVMEQRLAEGLRELAAEAVLRLVDVSALGSANVGVMDIVLAPSPVVVGDSVEITARIASYGVAASQTVPVAIQINGHTVSKQMVTVPPDGEGVVRAVYRFFSSGDHLVEISLSEHVDALSVDNHLSAIVSVQPALRVLCVDGLGAPAPLGTATRYLVMALNPGLGTQEPSPVLVDERPTPALVDVDLAPFDAVFLCNVAELTPGEADRLSRFVRQGGGLVIFLGQNTHIKSWNQLTSFPGGGDSALLPARLIRVVEDDPQFRLDPLGYAHPILEAFRGFDRAGLVTVPVEKFWHMELLAGEGGNVVMSLGNGRPLIVEKPVGRGSVVMVAVPADASWSLFPKWPSFVPLVHEILRFVTKGKAPRKNVRWGECLEGFFPPERAPTELVLVMPSGDQESLALTVESEGVTWRYCPRELSGIYRVQGGDGEEELFAVLRPPEESDLRTISADGGKITLGRGDELMVVRDLDSELIAPEASPHAVRDLTDQLLYALALLIVLEAFVAYYIGRRGL